MNDVADWDVVFEGNDGRECEQFILGVQKQAFARGMSKNDELIAQFVATHIGGEALRWYVTLDDEIQDSWKLLTQYPRDALSRLSVLSFCCRSNLIIV